MIQMKKLADLKFLFTSVAKGLAFYQIASATMDWWMWITLKDEGIFNNFLAESTVIAAIVSNYFFGILLILLFISHEFIQCRV